MPSENTICEMNVKSSIDYFHNIKQSFNICCDI